MDLIALYRSHAFHPLPPSQTVQQNTQHHTKFSQMHQNGERAWGDRGGDHMSAAKQREMDKENMCMRVYARDRSAMQTRAVGGGATLLRKNTVISSLHIFLSLHTERSQNRASEGGTRPGSSDPNLCRFIQYHNQRT